MRVSECLQHIVDRTAGYADVLKRAQPVGGRLCQKARRQQGFQFLQMSHPVGAGREAPIACQFRSAQHFERAQPVLLIGAADHDPFVGSLKCLIGRVQRVSRAHGFRRHAGCKRNGGLPVGLNQCCLEQGCFHPLALTGLQAVRIGCENAQACENAGGDVGQRRATFDRRPVGLFAGEAHDPAHGLGHQIEAAAMLVGAGASKAGQRAVNQGRVVLTDFGVAETEPIHDAGAKIFHQHVGGGEQAAQNFCAAGLLQVQRDALLVAVHHQKRCRFVADFGRNHVAGVVARRDFLDLDDLGAHVREHQRARRACHDMGQIDNLQSGQRTHCFSRDILFLVSCCDCAPVEIRPMPSRTS